MTLLRMSLSGGALVLAVLVLRSLFLDRLPKRLFPALWAVVVARLLLPVRIPVHLPVYERVEEAFSAVSCIVIPVPHAENVPSPDISGEAAAAAPAAAKIPLLPVIWAAVALALAAYFLISWLRCRREFAASTPVENDFVSFWRVTHPLKRRLEIRELDGLPGPLTFGILKPVILLPKATNWQDERSLRYALYHEYTHIRRFDALRKLSAAVALCLHWFNPLIWVMFALLNRDLEHACDEQVLHHYGATHRRPYALALLTMEDQKRRFSAITSSFSKNIFSERIESIMRFKTSTKLSRLISVMLTLVMIVAAVSSTVALAADEPEISDEEIALAYSDLDAAETDAEREAIIAARNKVIFSKSWTTHGATVTNPDGTVQDIPDFYSLFPEDWDLPAASYSGSAKTWVSHLGPTSVFASTFGDFRGGNFDDYMDKIEAGEIDVLFNGNVYLHITDDETSTSPFYNFTSDGRTVECYAATLPGDKCNIGIFNEDTGKLEDWIANVGTFYPLSFPNTIAGTRYGFAASVYSDPGWARMVVEVSD